MRIFNAACGMLTLNMLRQLKEYHGKVSFSPAQYESMMTQRYLISVSDMPVEEKNQQLAYWFPGDMVIDEHLGADEVMAVGDQMVLKVINLAVPVTREFREIQPQA